MEREVPDISRWVIVYPVYINSKKTLAEGRRIAANLACENPTLGEIVESCHLLKLSTAAEPEKAYSRDFMQRGRVRVQLFQKNAPKTPVNPGITSRKALMLKIAELVPTRRRDHQSHAAASSHSGASASSGRGGKGGRKKK
ncbi:hypothetical protein SELMODRAFT_160456 [Selaginella moellendorffii]|uniref:Signal recognition particle 19 kDa protein n=1 Tax=Selaginella moellendorffii TaxID=88036 RepID=D8T2Q1_SELML|nr:signal recognition particle 19 kDa protein [Selaginella moellendorffii]XP_002992001.1 signal recognition particle 19 kDa protein [Selaginella moellendorffii]XP_024519417.1 signal recognition particle 19 kDa protein [Selaginella moellendorffii]EFJ06969.1 hypothetical protein SELMODRAFT_134534 [Selaginella moellendorffii]EFJ09089.1 hypothetical protein SELMODRAFT_160456 [Selaginella moellendorffii]|eukprot:XP_002989822.1 signal recognition particle 19 kDa protein [Selaginella moellendorffii]